MRGSDSSEMLGIVIILAALELLIAIVVIAILIVS